MDIEETKRKRLLYLNRIYEQVGDNRLMYVSAKELAQELGLSQDESDRIRDYLFNEHLISLPSHGTVGITHHGIKEMERAHSQPEQPTFHFPPINLMQMGDVHGSPVIQQGTVTSTQNVNYSVPSADDLKQVIESIRNAIPDLALRKEDEEELVTETTVLEMYASSSKPKPEKIREALRTIRAILEGAAGSLAATGLIALLTRLMGG